MTINTKKITSGPYVGNDIADTFSYTFRIEDKTELSVYETDDQGTQNLLIVDTHYTVNTVGVDGGGTITRVSGALPSGFEWYIRSNFEETQLTAFQSQGAFFPDLHEFAMDKLTLLIQQLLDRNDRSPRLPDSYSGPLPLSLDEPFPGAALRWNGDLDGLENYDPFSALTSDEIAADKVVINYPTVTSAINDPDLKINQSCNIKQGGMWDVVASSGVTADGKYVFESIALPLLSIKMRVNWDAESASYYDDKFSSVKRAMEDGSIVRIVCLGDSLTAGFYPSALEEFLRDYYRNTNITVVQKAFSGYRSDQILAEWPTAVTTENPDMVILMTGMNDALQYATTTIDTFIDSMLSMYTLAKDEGRAIMSMNITPTMSHTDDVKRYIDLYRRSGVELADRHRVPNLDVNRIILNMIQKQAYNWHDIYTDFIHFNARGDREFAGMIFCYMLASERLVMTTGSKVPPIEPYFVYDGTANVAFTDALAPNSTNARITPSAGFDGAVMWFFVEEYEFSNLALECTRENHATKLPKLFVNNEEIANIPFSDYLLGTMAGASFKTNGAPIIVSRIKPGLNKIKIFSDTTSTAEFSTASIVTDEGVYIDLSINETFRDNMSPHSYSDGRDSDAKLSRETGATQIINPGKFATVGLMVNPTHQSQVHRMRCLPTDGFTLSMMRRNEFAEEYQLSLDVKFVQNGADIDITTTLTNTDGTTTQIDFVNQFTQTLNAETRIDILVTTISNGGGNTVIYKNGMLVSTIPFAIGASQLIALGAGAGTSMVNHLSTFTPGTNIFGEVSGERWVDFTTPASKMTISGVVQTI